MAFLQQKVNTFDLVVSVKIELVFVPNFKHDSRLTKEANMKSITEFQPATLQKILATKTALTAEGKTAEEIIAAVGETFKYEGDKIKYALAAAELAKDKTSVRRVLVASFGEGENPAPNYQMVEDVYYMVESFNAKPVVIEKADARGPRRGGGKNNKSAPKGSPWGMTPEEKAAKNKPAAPKS